MRRFYDAAKNSFGTRNSKISNGESNSKPWFNKSCKTARRIPFGKENSQ